MPSLMTVGTGCQTTVGNYFANRGRDFGECFLVQAGWGLGLGVHANVAGLAHVGGILSTVNRPLSYGWVYGDLRPTGEYRTILHSPIVEGDVGIPLCLFYPGRALHASDLPSSSGGFHACYGLLPALFSWTGEEGTERTWLWSGENEDPILGRWARVHAFDIEVSASALLLSARAGFSPGEFLDFLLGWFGIDIAGDDRGLVCEEKQDEGI